MADGSLDAGERVSDVLHRVLDYAPRSPVSSSDDFSLL